MGLLEKAQVRKQALEKKHDTESEKVEEKIEEIVEEEQVLEEKKPVIKKLKKETKSKGLLEKAQKRKKEIVTGGKKGEKVEETKAETPPVEVKKKKGRKRDVIEKRTGFGWKGRGTRRIVYDKETNEYIYELLEPELNEVETDLKNELSHLFKMLADINITSMTDEEKEQFLEETLEQIILDNDIRFSGKRKKKKTKDEKEKEKIGKKDKDKKDKKEKGKYKLFEKKEKKKEKGKFKLFEKKEKKKEKKTSDEPQVKKTNEELEAEEQERKDKIFYHLFRDFIGYGKIDIIMRDDGIEDISCDGHHVPIFIYHKKYDEISSNVWFDDEQELNSFVVRLAQISGKQISIYSPIVDGKLPDGSRLQTTLARTVTKGSTFTIRKFRDNPLTPIDLIDYQSLTPEMAAFFWMAIERGASILFCGGTASGKTTALNALSLFIPAQHKIITIEDTREINLPHQNWIAGTTREGFSSADIKTGKDIDMFDLIRAALRQRPKVVMVGEVRGREAYSLFQAMATGHTSYATVHASDIHTLIQRLENPPISLPRALLTSLDVIVFQNAIDIAGKTVRRMTSITEIVKLDPDTNQLIFMEPYKWISKTDDRFEASGNSKIMTDIRLQNDWSEIELCEELERRMLILNWMLKKNIRSYTEVGEIVNLYSKYPEQIFKKAMEEMKK
jgi:flagellar protein FlaI